MVGSPFNNNIYLKTLSYIIICFHNLLHSNNMKIYEINRQGALPFFSKKMVVGLYQLYACMVYTMSLNMYIEFDYHFNIFLITNVFI